MKYKLLALLLCTAATARAMQPDSLTRRDSVQHMAQTLIRHYEILRTREERQFSAEGFQPLLRGIVMTVTEKGFRNIPAPYTARENRIDLIDYLPAAAPLVTAWLLHGTGVESRSTLPRMATATGFSLALTAGLTLGLNGLIDEASPDLTSAHALPSGHTALAFASAAILSREYGHYSPWVTVGSYACATATQALRLRHDRHWINDIFLGAGIGTVSTNLAYFLADQIHGERGINPVRLRRSDVLRTIQFIDRPTGLRLISGTEVGNRRTTLTSASTLATGDMSEPSEAQIITSATFTSGADLNFNLTPYFSLDAILRAGLSTVKLQTLDGQPVGQGSVRHPAYGADQLAIYHADIAGRFTLPVSPTARFGLRAIGGLRHTTGCTFAPAALADGQSADPLPTFSLPRQTRFELGCGLDVELLSSRNYLVGFTGDYTHTFRAPFSNRYSICSFWKVMF